MHSYLKLYMHIDNILCYLHISNFSIGICKHMYEHWCMYMFAAKSLQSCPTLCDTIDRSPPGSPVPGILQARTLEWVAISFSNAWKRKVKVKSLSCLTLSDPIDGSPPGSSVHGIFQARVLEWGPLPSPICICFSSVQSLSHVRLFATPWIEARQASLSITNSRSSLRLTSVESMMPSSHLILCRPLLLCLQSRLS